MASADDIELARRRSGEGPRLLFIIGSGSTVDESELLVSVLSRHFDLLTYDHRGLDRSGVVTDPYDMATCAADALAVLDAEGWEQARVVGLSFGGMVAQELAPIRAGSPVSPCCAPRRADPEARRARCTSWRTSLRRSVTTCPSD
jgi:pimeloyl-ACP methyl ester carboxylesterase